MIHIKKENPYTYAHSSCAHTHTILMIVEIVFSEPYLIECEQSCINSIEVSGRITSMQLIGFAYFF